MKKSIQEILNGKNKTNVMCDYCNKPAKLKSGEEVYPHRQDLWKIYLWACDPCEAYVGCHGKSTNPKGRLANSQLRRMKMQAHAAFDPYWRQDGLKRKDCYARLAVKMGIKAEDCHIGMFSEEQCREVVKICNRGLLNELD